MEHGSHRKKDREGLSRLVLAAFVSVPALILALALLCLGRDLLAQAGAADIPLTVELPLSVILQETQTDAAETIETDTATDRTDAATDGTSTAAEETLWDQSVTLTVLVDGETTEMTLGDYLWGVVAAEMPASFEEEALKAQAVASRTYTVYRLLCPTDAHDADLCADADCCQAWMSRDERLELWGEDGAALADKISLAVADTDGMAVCYEGALIQAVFHASSAGATRSALEVWGTDVAYLQSVPSPEGEEVPNYYSVVQVSAEDFSSALAGAGLGCDLSGDISEWIGAITYDSSGLSAAVEIGGVSVPTSALRTLFSLRSACLTVEAQEDTVTFYVTGYGHGAGMSQYGANALAEQGLGWQEILTWYYSGTTIEDLADKSLDLE